MSKIEKISHRLFYEPATREFSIANNFLAVLTLVSVLSLILETVEQLSSYSSLFSSIEYVAVFFFTLEYIFRIVAKRKNPEAYVFSFFGIIDLLAIVPTFIGLSNLTFLKTARVLRILRLLRIIRLAKIARMRGHNGKEVEDYNQLYRLNIRIYLFALFAAVIIFGTLIYIFETDTPEFSSIPLGMLWAMKPLLGGVAQLQPTTVFGEITAILARFTGLILFGLLIAIMGSVVKRVLFGTDDIESISKKSSKKNK